MSEKMFGDVKKERSDQTWFSFFGVLQKRWKMWDNCAHHPGVSVDETGKIAECDPNCKNDTHLPVRGRQGVRTGRHYFEVSFVSKNEARPAAFSSLLCAVGVADKSFVTDRKVGAGYTKENKGIGYYSSGFQFLYGRELHYGNRVTYNLSNSVGLLLDMDKGEIQFFRDRKAVGHSQSLSKEILSNVELYPLVLSERGLVVTMNDAKMPDTSVEAEELPNSIMQ